jgi:hypothetical protein
MEARVMKAIPFIDYRLEDNALSVTVAKRPIRRIPYSDIESVQRGWRPWNEHWNRRLDFWRGSVTIRRKHGILRNVVLTPDDPDAFVAALQARVEATNARPTA